MWRINHWMWYFCLVLYIYLRHIFRFDSSAVHAFRTVYQRYPVVIQAFVKYREKAASDVPIKFLVRGWDFVLELCLIIDILSPVTHVMIKAQTVNQNLWNVIGRMQGLEDRLQSVEDVLSTTTLTLKVRTQYSLSHRSMRQNFRKWNSTVWSFLMAGCWGNKKRVIRLGKSTPFRKLCITFWPSSRTSGLLSRKGNPWKDVCSISCFLLHLLKPYAIIQ